MLRAAIVGSMTASIKALGTNIRLAWRPKKLMRADVDWACGQSTMDVYPFTFGARTPL
jgi:hypothetical protein